MKVDKIVVVALVLCAIILIGEFCTVNNNIHNYNSSAEWNTGYVEYSVSASGSEVYDAILLDNHGYKSTESLEIYVDKDYDKYFSQAAGTVPTTNVNQDKAYHEITVALQYRGFTNYEQCDDSKLEQYLNSSMGQNGKGLLALSYSLPSSVYDGTENCLLVKWIRNGGNLYWFSSEIGAFSKTPQGLNYIANNQMLFFGANNCICTEHETGNKDVNETTKILSLKNCLVRHGVDLSKATNTVKSSTGFTTNGYSTISMVSMGNGSVYVFSENSGREMYEDTAQIIASRINPYTTVVSHLTGNVTRGTEHGKIDFNIADPHLYLYIGGYYTVYGRAY